MLVQSVLLNTLLLMFVKEVVGAPEKCCYPEIWNAVVGDKGGFVGDSVFGIFHVSIDLHKINNADHTRK